MITVSYFQAALWAYLLFALGIAFATALILGRTSRDTIEWRKEGENDA